MQAKSNKQASNQKSTGKVVYLFGKPTFKNRAIKFLTGEFYREGDIFLERFAAVAMVAMGFVTLLMALTAYFIK